MESLSERLKCLAPSATMAMNAASKELKAKGVDVINLSVGEPDFNTPDHIKQAGKDAIDNNVSFYPPAAGFPELLKAISKKFKRENNLDYSPDQIVVSVGAKNSLANVILALIDKDDEVIVPAPYWVTYAELVKLAEGKNIFINGSIENKFKVTPQQIREVITPKTKAILICSPSNPTGSFYSKEELAEIAKILEENPRIFVIADEIYEHINFVGEHYSLAQFESIKEQVVIINGVSKAYAMTGWRIGYIGAPLWLAKACVKLQGQLLTGPTTNAQMAAIAALEGDQSCVQEMKKAFIRRKNLIMKLINDIPGLKTPEPDGAFYVFPQCDSFFGKSFGDFKITCADDLCLYLLNEGHVACVAGESFGEPKCFRISFATADEKIIEAMSRIKKALAALK